MIRSSADNVQASLNTLMGEGDIKFDLSLLAKAPSHIPTLIWDTASPQERIALLKGDDWTNLVTDQMKLGLSILGVKIDDTPKISRGKVTFDAEGNNNPKSPYFSRVIHWPGGASGVTIGRGYDMKFRTQAQVANDLIAVGVDKAAAQKFATGAGLSGEEARKFVRDNRKVFGEISQNSEILLFNKIYPKYVSDAISSYTKKVDNLKLKAPSWNQLDPKIREVVIDMTYQQGQLFDRQMNAIISNDRDTLAKYISSDRLLKSYEDGRHRTEYLRTKN